VVTLARGLLPSGERGREDGPDDEDDRGQREADGAPQPLELGQCDLGEDSKPVRSAVVAHLGEDLLGVALGPIREARAVRTAQAWQDDEQQQDRGGGQGQDRESARDNAQPGRCLPADPARPAMTAPLKTSRKEALVTVRPISECTVASASLRFWSTSEG
jgi:hypothetical protein